MLHIVNSRQLLHALSTAERAYLRCGIMGILSENPAKIYSNSEIIYAVYNGREPETADIALKVAIAYLRQHGFTVIGHKTRGYSHK